MSDINWQLLSHFLGHKESDSERKWILDYKEYRNREDAPSLVLVDSYNEGCNLQYYVPLSPTPCNVNRTAACAVRKRSTRSGTTFGGVTTSSNSKSGKSGNTADQLTRPRARHVSSDQRCLQTSLNVECQSLLRRTVSALDKNCSRCLQNHRARKSEHLEARKSRRKPQSPFAEGLIVHVMLRRDSTKGGQKVAIPSTSQSTRRRQSIADYYVLRFDPTIVWRKLQLWIRIRCILGRLHKKVMDEVIHDPSSPFYMQREEKHDATGIDRNHYMFFDPSDYKANRQMRTSQEVKRILLLPPHRRTKEELHCAMIGLRGISAIAEYPVRMQRHLAEHGTFQSYNAKRVIVKQGRPPEAFYYILYGRVIVAVRDDVTGKVEVKCHLHRGHAFGELAIIKDSCRLSSVITKNYTELLCLSSEVFQKYFMVGGVKNMNDPDQSNFVRSLNFLKGWPLALILDNTNHQNVTFGYFKRGSVLIKDSNYSDWIIIVKSGSLKVLKKLVRVLPSVSKKTGLPKLQIYSSGYLSFLRNNTEYARFLEQNSITLPPPQDEGSSAEKATASTEDARKKVRPPSRPHTAILGKGQTTRGSKRLWSAAENGGTSKLVEFKSDNQLIKANTTDRKTTPSPRSQPARAVSHYNDDDDDEVLEFEEKRTFLDDLDAAYKARAHVRTEADLNPQFVFVQTLTKGDVFGLAQCLFQQQPSLCVVSNGADCLLINKKFYLDNCSNEIIRRLRVEVSPYPSDEKLQEDLITRINWDVYKSTLLTQVYHKCKRQSRVS